MSQKNTPSYPSWSFHPVDPVDLHYRLSTSFGLECEGLDPPSHDPLDIVAAPFPDVNSPGFRERYLVREVLRKYPGFDLGIDTRKAALLTFMEGEEANRATNDRLHIATVENLHVRRIIHSASRQIGAVLGRFDWSDFWDGWRFGPGATVSCPSSDATVFRKLTCRPACTQSAVIFYNQLLKLNPMWAEACWGGDDGKPSDPERVEWDCYQSVPKNAKTDRSIGIPPDVNVALQLAVGRMLRGKLHRCGVDLSDQCVNQRLAREGSEDGLLATVDFANASGSISIALVWLMFGSLPDDYQDRTWLHVLDALRVEYTRFDDRAPLHRNELFSAMGNGYTFELESLIFWALGCAVCRDLGLDPKSVSIYGDDLVIPTAAYDLLIEVMTFAGFRINTDKTFATSTGALFRESCGKHFLDGRDVSPFYVDTPLDNPASIVLLANNITRWASQPGLRDGRLYSVWVWVLSHLDPRWQECLIPFGSEDDGIIVSNDELCPKPILSKSYPRVFYAWEVKTATITPRPFRVPDEERLLEWHYQRRTRRFKPPRVRHSARDSGKICSIWLLRELGRAELNWHDVEWITTTVRDPKRIGRVTSLWLGKRRSVDWAYLGPWVSEASFVEYDGRGFKDLWRLMYSCRDPKKAQSVVITRR